MDYWSEHTWCTLSICSICITQIIEQLKQSNVIDFDTKKYHICLTQSSVNLQCGCDKREYKIVLDSYGRTNFHAILCGFTSYEHLIGPSLKIRIHNHSRREIIKIK
jgi:hypothetical protein